MGSLENGNGVMMIALDGKMMMRRKEGTWERVIEGDQSRRGDLAQMLVVGRGGVMLTSGMSPGRKEAHRRGPKNLRGEIGTILQENVTCL